jgi:hypothetical protein
MSSYLSVAIVFACLLTVFTIIREVYDKQVAVIGIVLCSALYGGFMAIDVYEKEPSAIDVYRGKTTLEITYRDSVAVDSVVVYKMK